MTPIKSAIDYKKNLAVNTVKGKVNLRDITEHFSDYYRGKITLNIIWDFTNANLDDFPSEDIRCVAKIGRKYIDQRKGGKTAIVTRHDFNFALGRMLMVYTEMENFPVSLKTFHALDEAMRWIFET